MTDALSTLYEALYGRLRDASDVWGVRVFPDEAPAAAAMPYCVINYIDGGEDNAVKPQAADFRVNVRVIAGNLVDAMNGAAAISALLNDSGEQDTGGIFGDANWRITTVTQGRRLHDYDPYRDADPVYISGHQFEIFMQERV